MVPAILIRKELTSPEMVKILFQCELMHLPVFCHRHVEQNSMLVVRMQHDEAARAAVAYKVISCLHVDIVLLLEFSWIVFCADIVVDSIFC